MKDQRSGPQETHAPQEDQKWERRSHIQAREARLPAQQWARLLRQGDGIIELPPSLLERLAEAVGNSGLTGLLRRSGAEGPAVYTPDALFWEEPETEVNHIQTAPPALFPYGGWPERNGPLPQPAKPGRIWDAG